MRYYIELTLLPNPEVDLYFLWSKVFQQVHLGLVEMQDDQGQSAIGIAFPDYKEGDKFALLGSKLRLFAPSETLLESLNIRNCLVRLEDYVHITSIRPVPEKVDGYVIYQRRQAKTGKERLARRYAKRHQETNYEDALANQYEQFADEHLTFPFIQLNSLSSGHPFRIWISKQIVAQANEGKFSCYGLSASTALPHF
jgi:CRISPR-associated endonuclease Csy4